MDEDATDEFKARVVHELRSPLAAVVGCAETLERRWDELTTEQRRELLQALSRQAREATAVLEALRGPGCVP
jgi:signal transduction histidine kinase